MAGSNLKWLYGRVIAKARQFRKRADRGFGQVDLLLAKQYIARTGQLKLHLGCGHNIQDGWLNTDFEPRVLEVMQLDATKRFPFSSDTFDFVFSEHMIEHVSYESGMNMLAECHRVLKPGGTLRISTPDLHFLIDMTRKDKTDLQRAYLQWTDDTCAKGQDQVGEVFLINRFVREWGHTFIYDEATLNRAMEKAGFTGLVRCNLSESQHAALRNLENVDRMPPGMLELETLTIEGTK